MSRQVFNLPDLGEGLTDAELVNWLVNVGDEIKVDQPIAEVETAKSMVEVPSPFAGTVAELHGAAGDTIDVGKPLISVDAAGAAGSAGPSGASISAAGGARAAEAHPDAEAYRNEERAGVQAPAEPAEPAEEGGSGNVLIGYGTPGGHGGAKRTRRPKGSAGGRAGTAAPVAEPRAVPAAAPAVAAAPDRAPRAAVAQAVRAAEAGEPQAPAAPGSSNGSAPIGLAPQVISPLVRKMARDGGLSISGMHGSGPGGLILRRDVEAALAGLSESPAAAGAADAASITTAAGSGAGDARTGLGIATRTPMKGVRKTVAAAMSQSRREIPEATVWVDVDATALLEMRAALKKQDPDNTPGLLAFIARFVTAGLAKFPELNTRVENDEIVGFDGVNLGFAAQTDRGLMVPSIRRADKLSARELDAEIRRLAAVAREGKATPTELTSGTFTLNNYGVFGVDGSAAIINYPEVAILGVGRIIDKPWVVDGQLAVRKVTELTLAFDHRVCDGGTAGGFLRYIADAIESPGSVLADL
ncbi:dihydrolipoamide acetyltransferase family protein [Arthrobacter crystallopoietes]|uniref:Dihydrolipoamide acetyltransferase component of pyruvate dehydrogenase complex n=1 Tax=Crystallibacter crystallopoietes TaxID=37928 RepID=A0A1H1EQ01_9MICC|nr:dihydrolipoamide acetyltransferase family protein [Arthrobacter crystallopoietes]AUI49829.1 branched-chain alpha-keto acid dehydrogenase subunit E2 [Arthrobacter crystallopoietes]SDQ90674.1 pyruvate dehydrogenase E2 component (dihydrolipoamide acetyltransferase) [Arthrobacter crystallopoietes]